MVANLNPSESGSLLAWTAEDTSGFGQRPVLAHHGMHELDLFSPDALIDLLERYPRDRLQAFTMGTDVLNRQDWRPVDTTGVSGRQLYQAVQAGRFWLNIIRVQTVDKDFKELVDRLFHELTAQCPDFKVHNVTATLILSSPSALVYYHADAQPNLLWQIRGSKRVWVYPPGDRDLVPSDLLEDIFASFADEEVPYLAEFDRKAAVYQVDPGQVLSWPQNAPHRVTNLDCVNISLSTPYETEVSDRRKQVYCANRLFRRKYRLPLRSTSETGLASYAKRFAYRAWRRAGLIETPPRRAYVTDLRIDLSAPNFMRRLTDGPVLTEFSRKDFKLERNKAGAVTAVPLQPDH